MKRSILTGLGIAVAVALILMMIPRSWLVGSAEYRVRGRVAGFGDDPSTVIVEHEEIPGYMPPMTMPFDILDTAAVADIAVGDAVEFTYHVHVDSTWGTDLEQIPDDSVASHPAQNQLDVNLPEDRRILQVGDQIPDVTLVVQDSSRVRLEEYQGKLLLLTFIYTRCPLPDYCPMMSRHFETIHEELSEPVRQQVHLLSVSFDTRHDTPATLREYAQRYTDSTERWTFATGNPDQIGTLTSRLGVFYSYEDVETINHNLVTVLVDRQGQIAEIWRGNDWQPQDVIQEIQIAAEE